MFRLELAVGILHADLQDQSARFQYRDPTWFRPAEQRKRIRVESLGQIGAYHARSPAVAWRFEFRSSFSPLF
ncbi:MAG: hypothetical protein C5B57_10770 [Blastocatellia bacterium]|nr:MAG: hypothetical protein C5B57_10770 [Blastocatellia bacterium]